MTDRRDLHRRTPPRPAKLTGDPIDPAPAEHDDRYGTQPMPVEGMPRPARRPPSQPAPQPQPEQPFVPGVRVRGTPSTPRQFRFSPTDDAMFEEAMYLRGERPSETMRWFLRTYMPRALEELRKQHGGNR